MSELKSSEKGDERQEEAIPKSTKAVSENPITVDQLNQEDLTKMVLELKAKLEGIQERETRGIEEEEEEYSAVDDYMDIPAVFFCFSQEYNCHGDVRRGLEDLPPLGFVKFKPVYRYQRKAQKGVDVIAVSQTTVRSRTQSEWLRGHTLFGIKFFENIDEVQGVDTTLAEKMSEQSSRMSRMSDLQIIERAKAEKIPIHNDTEKLRKELIQKLALDEMRKKETKKKEVIEVDEDSGRIIEKSIINDETTDGDVY